MSFSAFTSSESGRARHGEAALGACHQLGYQSDPTLARSPDEFATDSVTVAAERRASTATSPAEADGESYISPHGLEESHATSRRTSLASASSLTSLSSASSTSSSAPLLKAQASVSSSIESSLQIPHSITPGNTHFRVASLGAITEVSENSNHFAEETGPTFQSRDSCSKSLAYSKNKALESTFQPITPEVKKSSVSSSITAVGDVSDDGFDDYDEKNKVDSDRPGPNGGVGPSGPEKEFMGHDKGFWSFRNVLIFSMACFGGLLFGFHTGYISGVLAMDFVENMQIAYNQRSEGWRSVTSIKHVDYPNGTHMVSRNESWTSSSGQQFGAGLPILGPINANNLWEALNYTQSNLDWNHLDIDTQTEIDAAFGWNNSSAPSWLLLDENVRPFWLCHISTHHIHKLGGDHHGDHLQHVREPEDDQDPTNMKSHYRYVSMAINRREEAAKTAAAPLPFEFTHHPRWFRLTAKERLLTVGMLSLGTAVGALFGGDISDYLGRRLTLVIGTVIFMIGVADQLASVDLASLTRGRAESGIAVGFITSVILVYLTEISPANMRGLVTVVFQFCITLGILFSAVITLATRKKWSRACYRVPIGFQFIWAVGLLVCLYWCPESPRWYYKIGQKNRAELAVIKLQRIPQVASEAEKLKADAGVKQEMEEIMYGRKHHVGEANVAPEEKDFSASRYLQSWKLCFKGPFQQRSCNLKRTLFGVCLMMFQQLTGVNFLFYFGAAFFKHHGFSNPFVLAVGLRAVNVISTLASFVVVPAVRRRALLMYGAAAMGLCQLTVGLLYVGSAGSDNEWMNIGGNLARPQHVPVWLVWTSMVFISLYIFAFATTWGPGAWSLLGDIFPMETRARAIGIATAFNWLTNAIVCFVTPLIVDEEHGNLGMKVFLVWSGCSFVAFGFVYFLVPETCGRTLEEVAFKFDFGARNVDDLSLEKGGRGGQVERIVSDWATILMEKEKEEDELKAKARAARAASKKWYSVIFNKDGSGSESGDSEDSDDDLKQKTERVGSTGSWWSAQTAVSDFRLPVYTQHANTEVSSGNSRVEVKYKKWNIFKKTVIKSFVDDEEGIDGSVSPKAVHKKE